jgi:hypothetical protein
MRIFYENVTHVETVNANVSKVSAYSDNRESSFQIMDPASSGIKIPKSVINAQTAQIQKPQNVKRKTVPCFWYHGEVGCTRGDGCDFIHDEKYKGKKVPNMKNYVRSIDKLSKNPENNLMNMMIHQSAIIKKVTSG